MIKLETKRQTKDKGSGKAMRWGRAKAKAKAGIWGVLLILVATTAAKATSWEALTEAAAQIERGRVLISDSGLGIDINNVDVQSNHVYDYTFSSAPTDWIARSGEWNATNRWTCSPQWSWYGGYSPQGVAALWNKRQFLGDITVELHLAFKMRADRDPTYLHPNDVNITICGDGANLDSGYAFIIGGEDNRWTRIMKGTRVLAETRDPKALWPIYENGQPSTYEWHRKWWELRVRKSGERLQIYLDGNLVLEGRDPQPLKGGRVALWVLRNDMITPRVKIYFEREKWPRDPMPPAPSPLLATTKIAEPEITLTASSHPSVQNDFENTLGSITTRDEDQGAVCSLVPDDPAGQGHCLQIANRAAGGNFGVNLYAPPFDARQFSKLAFDYRITPDAKVNLYLVAGNRQWEIIFNGIKRAAPGCEILGEIGGVIADGKWHHAEFDLLAALQQRLGLKADMTCRDLWAGNLNNDGYLLAGFGGNHMGTTWYLDNFYLGQSRGPKLELTLTPKEGVKVSGYAVAVDDKPHSAAPTKANYAEGRVALELAGDGVHYVHVRPILADGKPGTQMNYRVGVDRSGPRIRPIRPTPGESVDDQPVRLAIEDPGDSGPDLSTLQIVLGERSLTAETEGVSYDLRAKELQIDLRALGVTLDEGQRLPLLVQALADRAGNALTTPWRTELILQRSADKTPPPAPRVVFVNDGYLVDNDFERDIGQWAPYGDGGAVLSRDATTAFSGRYSLKLYCPLAGRRFGAYVLQQPFDAGKYRIVSFAYQCDDRLRADFAVYVNGDWKQIRFMDNDNELGVIGNVPNVQPDNQWHTTSFNLYDMLRAEDPQAPAFIVRQFVIADWGWAGNRPGTTYHIDDFQIIPIVSGAKPLRVAWQAPDVCGLAGIAYALDVRPSGVVPETINAAAGEIELPLSGQGELWLHVRAQDKAGNWSRVTARRLLVDVEPPTAQPVAPTPDERHAVSEIVLGLRDKGLAGIDPHSVRLRVGETEYGVDGMALRYDPQRGQLIWNCEEVRPNPVVFPDKAKVNVELVSAADYAGNPVAERVAWSWIMDYALDKTPPRVKEIHSTTHPTFLTQTFEDALVPWQTWDGANGAKVEIDEQEGAAGSQRSIKLTNQKAGGHMGALISSQPFDAERYPVIAFDYKIPPTTKLALTLIVRGRALALTLNDLPTDVIGRVPGIIADNRWRHAAVEIMPLLRRQFPEGPLVVEQIIISDRNVMDNAAGAEAHFDNFIVGQIGKYPPVLRWRATDTTGIEGYSIVLDQNSATVPDETIDTTEVAKSFEGLADGIYYFHIRALDGAGNWGPPITYALFHGKAD